MPPPGSGNSWHNHTSNARSSSNRSSLSARASATSPGIRRSTLLRAGETAGPPPTRTRRTPGSSSPAAPEPALAGRRVADHLARTRGSRLDSDDDDSNNIYNTNDHTENPRNRPRNRQLADRDFEAEYEGLLHDFEHQAASQRLFNPSTGVLRILEPRPVPHGNLTRQDDDDDDDDDDDNDNDNDGAMPDREDGSDFNNLANLALHDFQLSMSLLAGGSGGDDTRQRTSHLDVPGREARTVEAALNPGDEDDPDAVRAMWNRIARHRSSPFSPPQHPSNLSPARMSPGPRPLDYAADDSRRTKRRKIDSDRVASSFKGFRYGKYGQVEPGELKMEIVSCDGGLYSNESNYAYENILRNDKTVYCTKSSRCNIVLRHQGATVFSLKELVIKAPGSHCYSSPVREGMVFVSMNQDELLNRTAQYQIQYTPSRSPGQGRSRPPRPLAPIISIRHNEDGSIVTRTTARRRRHFGLGLHDDDDDDDDDDDEEDDNEDYAGEGRRTAQIPREFASEPPPFHITTECSDDESDDDAGPRIPVHRRAPNRIGALPFESESSDEGVNMNSGGTGSSGNSFAQRGFGFGGGAGAADELEGAWAPASRRRDTQNMTLAEAIEAHGAATQEAVRAVGGGPGQGHNHGHGHGLMAPHAKFYIEKEKSRCTIRFDPPVSGRFILLKMWSPHREGSNIDIQAVVAKGFAGPRYFPSVELR